MKKVILGIFCTMLLLTGCTKSDNNTSQKEEKTKTMTCTRTANQSNLSMDVKYEINYKGDYVTIINSTEKVISDNPDILDQYKATLENFYEPYKDIEYYNYDIKIDENTLTSTVKIDYENIDTDKMIDVDSANAQLIQNGNVKIGNVKQVYESVGAICK